MNITTPKIYITMGDINGIGPEVILKSLQEIIPQDEAQFFVIGSKEALDFYQERLSIHLNFAQSDSTRSDCQLNFVPVYTQDLPFPVPGKMAPEAGLASIRYIEEALTLVRNQPHSGIVTGPVCKEAIWKSGLGYIGQTELLADSLKAKRVTMMLMADGFRVGLVTTHHPIKEVANLLDTELIVEKTITVERTLRSRFRIENPKIAITAFNPHGGENGMLGDEENLFIKPAVSYMQSQGIQVQGPFPADTLFAAMRTNDYDAYMAMYHDQGMIPVKLFGFGKAVNFTAGLPVIRTSPDHGTAFDIAGQGTANPSSMKEAIRIAIRLAKEETDSG